MRIRGLAQRLPFVIAALLLPLLIVLAVLQWHWIGQVSAMERQRMRASLLAAGSRFTHEFDREIARAFLTFHPGPTEPASERLERVFSQYRRWTSEAPYPHLIRDVFLVVQPNGGQAGEIQILRPAERRFEPCPWPAELAGVRRRVGGTSPPPSTPGSFGMPVWVDGDVPALVVPLAFFRGPQPREVRQAEDPLADALLVLRFNREAISNEIFPALAREHFETPQGSDYAVAVVDAHDPRKVLFRSDPQMPMAAFDDSDLSLGLLGLRPFEELRLLEGRHEAGHGAGHGAGEPRRRSHFPFWGHRRPAPSPEGRWREAGEWRLVAKRRDGSLEQAVGAIRRRNLGISLGTLALLAITSGLMVLATQRAQRLARHLRCGR